MRTASRLPRTASAGQPAGWLATALAAAAISMAFAIAPARGAPAAAMDDGPTMARAVTVAGGAAPPPLPRVVTLAPHVTEIVYAAGGGDYMAGTVSSSDFPEAARALPRVGDGITLNQERLIVLRPTLIVGWRRSGAAIQAEALAGTLDARIVYSAPARLRDIPADVRKLGRMLGTEAAADAAASAMEARIASLEARYAGRPSVSVFVEVGSLPLYTIGGDPLLNDALRACGAVNLYGDTRIAAPRVPIENVLVRNPGLIVAAARKDDDIREARKRWAAYGLPAALQGRVHGADPDALFRPGPRFIDATESLCKAIDATRDGLR